MTFRIGTRSSKMALVQANWAAREVEKRGLTAEICPMLSDGDKDLKSPLHLIGGKGVFVKRIEQALLDGQVDMAVHSLKDMTATSPAGLETVAYLETETARDAVVGAKLSDLPKGALVATGSLRRKALLKRFYPHLVPMEIRGNVLTRLEALEAGHCQAMILSQAGLSRLGLDEIIEESLPEEVFCPPPGGGVVALQMRRGEALKSLGSEKQRKKTEIEWRFLEQVGLDCRSPLGAHVSVQGNRFQFHLFVANRDLSAYWDSTWTFSELDGLGEADRIAKETLLWLESQAASCS